MQVFSVKVLTYNSNCYQKKRKIKYASPGTLFQAASVSRVSTIDVKRGFPGQIENLMKFGDYSEGKGAFLTRLEVIKSDKLISR